MKYSKAAAVVAGSVIALGGAGAAPAFADGGFAAPGDGAAKLMGVQDELADRGLRVVGSKAGKLLGGGSQVNPSSMANLPVTNAPVSSSPAFGAQTGNYPNGTYHNGNFQAAGSQNGSTQAGGTSSMLGGLPLGG